MADVNSGNNQPHTYRGTAAANISESQPLSLHQPRPPPTGQPSRSTSYAPQRPSTVSSIPTSSASSSSTLPRRSAQPVPYSTAQPLTASLPSPIDSAAASILKDKVALALEELDRIKRGSYNSTNSTARPSTASVPVSNREHTHSASLRSRLNQTINNAPNNSTNAGAADTPRNLEELRMAKSILRKLYKRNVQLTQELKQLVRL